MDKTTFERLVEEALLETASLELAPALNGIDLAPPPLYSARHIAWEKRFLADPFRHARRHSRDLQKRMMQFVVCVILAFTIIFGIIVVYPNVRAWVMRLFTKWFGERG